MDWKDLVAATFGGADVRFAAHPLDRDRAKAMIQAALDAGATREDVSKELVWHIYKAVEAGQAPDLKAHIDAELSAFGRLWPADAR